MSANRGKGGQSCRFSQSRSRRLRSGTDGVPPITFNNPHCILPNDRAATKEALLPTPVGGSRFVIRATHERGVGVPSSRSFVIATHEATSACPERVDPRSEGA